MQHYRPEIDGLRSLAVLGVLFYHFNLLRCTGGFLGVDVFFVISGYLIGGIVFDEIARTGMLSLSAFWLRRARRILPALFCMLAITSVFAWGLLADTTLMPGYARSLLTSVVSLSNFLFFSESGYFDTRATTKPLLHTWSLAVEEQFYLLFPLLALFCLVWLKADRRAFLFGLLGCVVASWAACLLIRPAAESFAFFMLPTRLWEPLAGCALAYAVRERPLFALSRPFHTWLELAAMAVVLGCMRFAPHGIGFGNTLVVLATLALIASRQGVVSKILALRPLVWIGKISYSLYLWHWPILVLASLYWLHLSKSYRVSLLLLSVLCAWLSYLFVEQPFRQRHIAWRHVGRRLLPVGAGLCIIGVAGVLLRQAPLIQRPDEPMTINPSRSIAQIDQDDVCHLGVKQRVQFLVFGDSHAGSISQALAEQSSAFGVSGAVCSAIGVFPHPDYQGMQDFAEKSAFARSVHAYIKRHQIKTVLLAARWNSYIFGKSTRSRWKMAYRNAPVSDTQKVFAQTMNEVLREWLDAGVSVYILEQVPEHAYDSMERASLVRSASPAREYVSQVGFLSALVRKIEHPNLHLLRTGDIFRDGDEFVFVKDGKMLYVDDNHLNLFGARLLTKALAPFFAHVQAEAAPSGHEKATPARSTSEDSVHGLRVGRN